MRRLAGWLAWAALVAAPVAAQIPPTLLGPRASRGADTASRAIGNRGRALLGTDDFRETLSRPYWTYIASQPCNASPWVVGHTPGPVGAQAAADTVGAAFRRYLGFLPAPNDTSGRLVSRTLLYSDRRYQVEVVRWELRLRPARAYGLLVTPHLLPTDSSPAVILYHGTATVPRQAIGWRYGGAEPIGYDQPPFLRMAVDLAQMGFTVLVPYIRDDQAEFWPYSPWISIERAGGMFHAKRNGTALGLMVSQTQSTVDFLASGALPGVDTSRIAVVGWEEGADLGAVGAALDPRIKAVVRLMAPIDRRRWRGTAAGVRANPGFMQFDCTFGEPEQAALIAPRPQLYDWTTRDATFGRHRYVVDTNQALLARQVYADLGQGGDVTLQHWNVTGSLRAVRVGRWLERALRRPPTATLPNDSTPPVPVDRSYSTLYRGEVFDAYDVAIARLGTCVTPPFPDPSFDDPVSFRRYTADWRTWVAARLRVGPPRTTRLHLASRTLIERNSRFTLEWIVLDSTLSGLPLAGLLATPVNNQGRHPALVTFDGDFNAGEPFGLLPQGRTQYLKEYGRRAAERGVVVFAPAIPAWFAGAGGAALEARDPEGSSVWTLLIAQARAAVDYLVSRPDVNSDRITMQGISMVGVLTLYAAALDPRITTVVYSNPIVTTDSLYHHPDGSRAAVWYTDICSSLNQVQQYLIAPRRFIWENGVNDQNGYERTPLEAARKVADIYQAFGVGTRFTLLRHPGGHEEAPDLLLDLDPYGIGTR